VAGRLAPPEADFENLVSFFNLTHSRCKGCSNYSIPGDQRFLGRGSKRELLEAAFGSQIRQEDDLGEAWQNIFAGKDGFRLQLLERFQIGSDG
jgi:hypothetical protein